MKKTKPATSDTPNRATRRAIRAADRGKLNHYKDFEDFKRRMDEICGKA